MKKRITSFLLALLLIASSAFLVACNDSEETSSNASVEDDTNGFLNETKNWGGETVTILGYNGEYSFHSVQIDTEELTDEPVNDAFYARNALIEEQFGIDIEVVLPAQDEWHINMLREDMSSGLNTYDAVVCPITYIAPLGIEGELVDFRSINNGYLHLDQEWWDQTMIRDITINDKIFFLAGDALVEDDESTWAIFFNKDLVQTYGVEDPYAIVREQRWTLDKMYELIRSVERTVGDTKDYDGSLAADGDLWGMVAQSYDFYLFMQGCEQRTVDSTGDVPVLRIEEEVNVDTFYKIADIIYDEKNVGVADYHGSWTEGIYQTEIEIFANGNALFMPGAIATIGQPTMRDAEIKYGILPMPKRSELQENYSTSVTVYHCAVISIPITNVDKLDVTSYALEAMAYYGKELVTPEYYDRTLTYKRFADDDSADMLELIFRNRTYDLGGVFNFNGGDNNGTLGFYTDLLATKSRNIISHFDIRRNSYQAGIDNLIAVAYND